MLTQLRIPSLAIARPTVQSCHPTTALQDCNYIYREFAAASYGGIMLAFLLPHEPYFATLQKLLVRHCNVQEKSPLPPQLVKHFYTID